MECSRAPLLCVFVGALGILSSLGHEQAVEDACSTQSDLTVDEGVCLLQTAPASVYRGGVRDETRASFVSARTKNDEQASQRGDIKIGTGMGIAQRAWRVRPDDTFGDTLLFIIPVIAFTAAFSAIVCAFRLELLMPGGLSPSLTKFQENLDLSRTSGLHDVRSGRCEQPAKLGAETAGSAGQGEALLASPPQCGDSRMASFPSYSTSVPMRRASVQQGGPMQAMQPSQCGQQPAPMSMQAVPPQTIQACRQSADSAAGATAPAPAHVVELHVPEALQMRRFGLELAEDDLEIAGFADPRAALHGFQVGDRVLEVDGVPVFDAESFGEAERLAAERLLVPGPRCSPIVVHVVRSGSGPDGEVAGVAPE